MAKNVNNLNLQKAIDELEGEIQFLQGANQMSVFRSQDIRQIVLASEHIGISTMLALKRLKRIEKFLNIPESFT